MGSTPDTGFLFIKKPAQNLFAISSHERLRVKLDAIDPMCLVFQSHDITFPVTGSTSEPIGNSVNNQGVIAGSLKRIGQPLKQG